jgi:hypothetical protein
MINLSAARFICTLVLAFNIASIPMVYGAESSAPFTVEIAEVQEQGTRFAPYGKGVYGRYPAPEHAGGERADQLHRLDREEGPA